jgi:hypothetical protein
VRGDRAVVEGHFRKQLSANMAFMLKIMIYQDSSILMQEGMVLQMCLISIPMGLSILYLLISTKMGRTMQ